MLLLHNGKLHNCSPVNTALAVHEGKIIAVGNDAEILNLASAETERIDLGGRYILPGLTDSHIHFDLYSQSLTKLHCVSLSRRQCLDQVKNRSEELPPGRWILGHGWNQNFWPEGYGTASDLDRVVPLHPVLMTDVSLHCAWVNSKALELAGIDADTPDPEDGLIQRDEKNHPTGILYDKAIDLVENVIPPLTLSERKQHLLTAQERLLRLGITSIHDFDRIPCFQALQELEREEQLILRVVKSLPVEKLDEAVEIGLRTGFGSDHLRIGPIKLFADGALGPQTAAMLSPYEMGGDNRGTLLLDAEGVCDIGCRAAQSGLSLAVHAIGDLATREVLLGLSKLREYEREHHLPALAHRIEHFQLVDAQYLELAAESNICLSMQPVHLYNDMQTADRFWGGRSRYAYAFNSLKSRHTSMVFGSDAPVENPNPFWGIHAAVARSMQGENESWYPEERLDLNSAIDAYTIAPARQAGLHNKLGELKPGRWADLLILDQHPYQIPPSDLYTLQPVMVMTNGQWYYRII
jgi:predicted amidohydrolase YtcJ